VLIFLLTYVLCFIVAMIAPNTCLPLPRSALGFKATGGIGVRVFMQPLSVYYCHAIFERGWSMEESCVFIIDAERVTRG
jgi:hypothetical protein